MVKIAGWVSTPPSPGELTAGGVHIWKIALDAPTAPGIDGLSAQERARAEGFSRARDRTRFVAARSGLRAILALYAGGPPAEIAFEYNRHGKPALAAPLCDIDFNLSHAREFGLLAVSRSRPVGIDLEHLAARRNASAIAARLFGESFARALEGLPEKERTLRFLTAWTGLEAQTKALGTGVFARRGAQWEVLPMTHFQPMPGWVAALASPLPLPPPETWRCFAWPSGPRHPSPAGSGQGG